MGVCRTARDLPGAAAGGRWYLRDRQRRAPVSLSHDRELELPAELPLGIVPDLALRPSRCSWPRDRLTLYTDGLLEARNPSGELYGFDRVCALIATHPDAQTASDAAVALAGRRHHGADCNAACGGVESTTRLAAPELVSAV